MDSLRIRAGDGGLYLVKGFAPHRLPGARSAGGYFVLAIGGRPYVLLSRNSGSRRERRKLAPRGLTTPKPPFYAAAVAARVRRLFGGPDNLLRSFGRSIPCAIWAIRRCCSIRLCASLPLRVRMAR